MLLKVNTEEWTYRFLKEKQNVLNVNTDEWTYHFLKEKQNV